MALGAFGPGVIPYRQVSGRRCGLKLLASALVIRHGHGVSGQCKEILCDTDGPFTPNA